MFLEKIFSKSATSVAKLAIFTEILKQPVKKGLDHSSNQGLPHGNEILSKERQGRRRYMAAHKVLPKQRPHHQLAAKLCSVPKHQQAPDRQGTADTCDI